MAAFISLLRNAMSSTLHIKDDNMGYFGAWSIHEIAHVISSIDHQTAGATWSASMNFPWGCYEGPWVEVLTQFLLIKSYKMSIMTFALFWGRFISTKHLPCLFLQIRKMVVILKIYLSNYNAIKETFGRLKVFFLTFSNETEKRALTKYQWVIPFSGQ